MQDLHHQAKPVSIDFYTLFLKFEIQLEYTVSTCWVSYCCGRALLGCFHYILAGDTPTPLHTVEYAVTDAEVFGGVNGERCMRLGERHEPF